MGGACNTYGGEDMCIQGFGGKPRGKRPLGRPTRRCEDNNQTDLQEVWWGAWTGLIWLRIQTGGGHL